MAKRDPFFKVQDAPQPSVSRAFARLRQALSNYLAISHSNGCVVLNRDLGQQADAVVFDDGSPFSFDVADAIKGLRRDNIDKVAPISDTVKFVIERTSSLQVTHRRTACMMQLKRLALDSKIKRMDSSMVTVNKGHLDMTNVPGWDPTWNPKQSKYWNKKELGGIEDFIKQLVGEPELTLHQSTIDMELKTAATSNLVLSLPASAQPWSSLHASDQPLQHLPILDVHAATANLAPSLLASSQPFMPNRPISDVQAATANLAPSVASSQPFLPNSSQVEPSASLMPTVLQISALQTSNLSSPATPPPSGLVDVTTSRKRPADPLDGNAGPKRSRKT